MKIEMGESLFYSWLRHVKDCQIVQTNWTTSTQWILSHQDELEAVMTETADYFFQKYGYSIYKRTSSLSQLLQQAECDAIGISVSGESRKVFAVDVAFHEGGLNYGDKRTTTIKIIAKCLRTAMCIYGFLDTKEAEIIFASPKIHNAVLIMLTPHIGEMQEIMNSKGFGFRFRLIANEDFRRQVLDPILLASNGIADTNELFLRSYQLIHLLEKEPFVSLKKPNDKKPSPGQDAAYNEFKIGKLAKIVMGAILESGAVSVDEIQDLQTLDYSHSVLGINYPCLAASDRPFDRKRYYTEPLHIHGKDYYLCSQWFETAANNDRPQLIAWINAHSTDLSRFDL